MVTSSLRWICAIFVCYVDLGRGIDLEMTSANAMPLCMYKIDGVANNRYRWRMLAAGWSPCRLWVGSYIELTSSRR